MRGLRIALVSFALLAARDALATTAADVPCAACPPLQTSCDCVVVSSVVVTDKSTLDFRPRGLAITSAGQLDARGGTMSILAANLIVQGGGLLVSRAGSIDVTTSGDIRIEVAGNSKGKIDVTGDSGGFVTLTASGDLVLAGQVLANGTLAAGDGGAIDMTGTNVTLTGRASATGGQTGFGGDASVSAVIGGVTISGTIDSSAGGDGGTIAVDADGDVTVTANALLDANAGGAGSADSIDITSFGGNISLAGLIRGHGPGDIVLGGGSGADLCVDAFGKIANDASIDVSGGGQNGLGGSADFTTDGDIIQTGPIDVSATGSGGYAGILSFTTVTGKVDLQAGNIDVSGPGAGGDVSVFSFNGVRVANRITADGPAASIDLQGCNVDVPSTARLSSVGANGANVLHASGLMTVAGVLSADPIRVCSNDRMIACTDDRNCHVCQNDHTHACTGAADCGGLACDSAAICTSGNTLEYLDPTMPPRLTGAVISPPPVQLLNPALIPCGGFPSTTTTSTTSTTTTATNPDTTTTTSTTPTTIATTPTTLATTSTTTTSTTATTVTTLATTTTAAASTTTQPTTTTTQPANAACDPPECDDGNACTDDSCDPVHGCVHDERAGFDAVTCRLDSIVGLLQTAPLAEVGGPVMRGKFQAKVGKAQRMVDAGRATSGKRQVGKLKKANKLIGAFILTVEKGQHKGKVKEPVASEMINLASGAQSSLLPYIAP